MKIKMNKSLKILISLVTIFIASIMLGYLAYVVVFRSVGAENFELHKALKSEIQADIEKISEKLETENLITETPDVDIQENKIAVKPLGIKYTVNFVLSEFDIKLVYEYSHQIGVKHLSVQVNQSNSNINRLNLMENEKLQSFLKVLDDYYRTTSFSDLVLYFDEEYLIESYEQNKNESEICSYGYATHNNYYDSVVGYQTGTAYSYAVTKTNSQYTLETSVVHSID